MTFRLHQRQRGRARSPLRAADAGSTTTASKRRAWSDASYLVAFLLLLALQTAQAQTADDFFNGGAQLYISNNVPSALERTEAGLKLYPNDEKLKKLEELFKQQQQQQNQQQQNQQNQQSQQSQSQQQQQKDQQKQQPQNQQQQNQSQQNQQQQQNQQAQQKQQQNKSGQKENQEPQQAGAKQGKEMTPEEAKQLLDSQKGDEQMLKFSPQGKPENQNHPVKDW